ncbi:uncharacterized protein LAESUDRAFT_760655 [Laetiporus sulphureus 93-53]|uniref:WH1-domain-containing protein n=1 Tax=Laetiporus sulphureus 93-53 TaxID=1314785 RepID=A0A165DHN8_9APHY|nr:uncharacterized protein LAESUDRAFT_760655 [Laetiporus sulphureus 93-53]KZT04903.1 hypothetical protein LAESUDRAFT_760655 [Laetiporus sulphureus 93-53]
MSRTPSSSYSSPSLPLDDKRHILPPLPTNVVELARASGRLYQAPFDGRHDAWTYTGLRGTIIFGRDPLSIHASKLLGRGPAACFEYNYWLKIVDPAANGHTVWMHDIPTDFKYSLDKPFFHIFAGKTRMFGLRFDDDTDGEKFYKKVTSNVSCTVSPPGRINRSPSPSSRLPTPPESPLPATPPLPASPRISKSMISSPNAKSFKHVSHIGYTDTGRVEASENLEPGWIVMLEELHGDFKQLPSIPSTPSTPSPRASARAVEGLKGFVEGSFNAFSASKSKNENADEPPRKRKSPHRKPVAIA